VPIAPTRGHLESHPLIKSVLPSSHSTQILHQFFFDPMG
jgi:hypothetical protein